jgi:membrane AbrB-like protein
MSNLGRIVLLVALSAGLAALLEWAGLPAGLLIGPMIVAVAFAACGITVALPRSLSRAGQSIVGILIATSFTPALLTTVADQPLLFIGTTAATLLASVVVGVVLTRLQVLPGTVAVWGSMPGAATAMTLMAREFGADERLVAVTTFSRVACVAALASVIAALLGGGGGAGHGPGAGWFPAIHLAPFATTIAIALVGAVGGIRIGLPAGALIGPMIVAGALGFSGRLDIELPGWLLAISYALVGWTIGLGFTRDVLRAAASAMPRILLSVASLIAFGAGLALLLMRITGLDLLTCYLATSPGGADSVAIIASETKVDVAFVMAMQVFRFIAVLVAGPAIAKFIAVRMAR